MRRAALVLAGLAWAAVAALLVVWASFERADGCDGPNYANGVANAVVAVAVPLAPLLGLAAFVTAIAAVRRGGGTPARVALVAAFVAAPVWLLAAAVTGLSICFS